MPQRQPLLTTNPRLLQHRRPPNIIPRLVPILPDPRFQNRARRLREQHPRDRASLACLGACPDFREVAARDDEVGAVSTATHFGPEMPVPEVIGFEEGLDHRVEDWGGAGCRRGVFIGGHYEEIPGSSESLLWVQVEGSLEVRGAADALGPGTVDF